MKNVNTYRQCFWLANDFSLLKRVQLTCSGTFLVYIRIAFSTVIDELMNVTTCLSTQIDSFLSQCENITNSIEYIVDSVMHIIS